MSKTLHSLKRLSVENGSMDEVHDDQFESRDLITKVEEIVPGDDPYVLALCGTQSQNDFRIGAALSSNECVIYSVGESFNKTLTLSHCTDTIVGVKFSPTSRHIIYIVTNNGEVTSCDLRAKGKVVAEFKDETSGKLRPLASFDISCDERLLAAGTEHVGGDTFILFWDIRNGKNKDGNSPLGGYWESHVEEATSLAFHPTRRDGLASGSTDGLINIYDLSQTSEDAALSYSLNTECSVDRIGWINEKQIWCTEHTELQLWNYDGATPYAKYERNSSQGEDYFVKVHTSQAFEKPFVLVGSLSGKETLKCMHVGEEMEHAYNLVGNKQIVRDSWIHEKSGTLITGGESSILNLWRQPESQGVFPTSPNHKSVSKLANNKVRDRNRAKPY